MGLLVHLQISELDALLFDDLHFHRLEVHANGDACLHHCSEAILARKVVLTIANGASFFLFR